MRDDAENTEDTETTDETALPRLVQSWRNLFTSENAGYFIQDPDTIDFIIACGAGDLQTVERLIDKVDISTHDHLAFRWAAGNPVYKDIDETQYKILDLLIAHGADISANDHEAYRDACIAGNIKFVQYLKKHGQDLHFQEGRGVYLAAHNNRLPLLRYLIEEEKVDFRADEDAALRAASEAGWTDIFIYLAESGANIRARDDAPLEHAVLKYNPRLVWYIMNHIDDINALREHRFHNWGPDSRLKHLFSPNHVAQNPALALFIWDCVAEYKKTDKLKQHFYRLLKLCLLRASRTALKPL